MLEKKHDSGGLYCYLATPYDSSGQVSLGILEKYVDQIVEAGVTGVTCLASTCEGPYLTSLERTEVLKTVCQVVNGRTAINVGIGALSTNEAIENAQQAEKLGATCLMLEMQQYFPTTFEAAYRHYESVAQACDVPIRLYNLTLPTRFDFAPADILNMSALQQITSVKEASNDVSRLRDIRMLCGNRYTLFCGFHYQALDGFRFGAEGWEVMMHPVIAPALVDLYQKLITDPWSEVATRSYQRLQPLFYFFKQFGVPQSIKEIAKRTDLQMGEVRAPLPQLSKIAKSRLHQIIDELSLESIDVS